MRGTGILLCLLLILASDAQVGRETIPGFIHSTSTYAGLYFELWNYEGTSSIESVLPLYGALDLQSLLPGLTADIVTSPTVASQINTAGSESNTLFGVSNTKLRASYAVLDYGLVTAGIQVPTGGNNLSAQQNAAANAVATRPMSYQISRVGSGVDGDFTVSTSYEIVEDVVLGGSLGLLLHGPYTPVKGKPSYNPGNEFSITAGGDYSLIINNANWKFLGDFVTTLYGADRIEKTKVLKPGVRFTLNLRGVTSTQAGKYWQHALTCNFRSKQSRFAGARTTHQPSGNEFIASTNCTYTGMKKYMPDVLFRISAYTPSGGDVGGALVGGVGGGISPAISRNMAINARIMIEGGEMAARPLFGGEISGGVKYAF